MNNIPPKLRKQLSEDPEYKTCLRNEIYNDHVCLPDPVTGKLIEWEHAVMYAGKQIQERWAIIPICYWAHRGSGLNKRLNQKIAVSRAEPEDLAKYPRKQWSQYL